jgi:hypothetical protein
MGVSDQLDELKRIFLTAVADSKSELEIKSQSYADIAHRLRGIKQRKTPKRSPVHLSIPYNIQTELQMHRQAMQRTGNNPANKGLQAREIILAEAEAELKSHIEQISPVVDHGQAVIEKVTEIAQRYDDIARRMGDTLAAINVVTNYLDTKRDNNITSNDLQAAFRYLNKSPIGALRGNRLQSAREGAQSQIRDIANGARAKAREMGIPAYA